MAAGPAAIRRSSPRTPLAAVAAADLDASAIGGLARLDTVVPGLDDGVFVQGVTTLGALRSGRFGHFHPTSAKDASVGASPDWQWKYEDGPTTT
jgi:hypothetical protein